MRESGLKILRYLASYLLEHLEEVLSRELFSNDWYSEESVSLDRIHSTVLEALQGVKDSLNVFYYKKFVGMAVDKVVSAYINAMVKIYK